MPTHKTCIQCGADYTCQNRFAAVQKFCGAACYRAHEKIHGREGAVKAERFTFSCQTCGNPIVKTAGELRAYRKTWGKDPVYCSRKCTYLGMRLKDEDWQTTCVHCGKTMPVQRRPGGTVNRLKRLCSHECRSAYWKANYQRNNPDLKPTRFPGRWGYVRLHIPPTKTEPPYDILEHRYVMQQRLGRPLRKEETVHHKDGVRSNNVDENLELFASRHGPGQRVTDQIEWAVKLLSDYPEFTRAAGFNLVPVEH